ncbi:MULTISPECIES: hypothetical protein [unclassified Caulobacter]|uniref:hypothetical protein n=1 Tax=unclassified Caulobacter TaxID=2648921 RepID=UPI000D339804|nr:MULTISPECIES: hypothetical protein [unclassified Caulobacter]PTT04987.1 hypothetical protein DBR10_17095 [Caulobacter sp. HMWF025]
MIWRPWLIAAPVTSTIPDEIVAAMLAAGHWVTEPEPTNLLVIKVADPEALTHLHTKLAGVVLSDFDEFVGTDEFVVTEADRPECERHIADRPPSIVSWKRLTQIGVGDDNARRDLMSRYEHYRQAVIR